ncbi:hypothetical protein V2J09_001659 [Rumex salicifolius]
MAAFNGTQSSLPASFTQLMTLAGRGGSGMSTVAAGMDCRGGGLFTSAEDNRLSKLVEERHSPDGRCLDIGRLLPLVQDIFARATQTVKLGDEAKTRGALTLEAQPGPIGGGGGVSIGSGFVSKPAAKPDSSPDLALTIERVSCEMGCKCLDDTVDGHGATLAVLGHVSHYPWEAKLVLTQAAFAVNYGEFLLLSQVYSTSPLAQSMAQIKQLPSILKNGALMRQLEAIGGLIKAMLDVTKLVVEIAGGNAVSPDEDAVKNLISLFPMTVYYVIRSAVAAAGHISLISTTATDEYMPSTTELELTTWTNKLKLIFDYLGRMKKSVEQIMDNMAVMGNLIYPKTDLLPLFDGDTQKKVKLGVLNGKTVLLLISGLDMDPDQLTKLKKIYNESSQLHEHFTIVWVPMVDPTATWSDSQFDEVQSSMPWYSVSQPSIISKAAIRLFIQGLNFKGKPIVVSVDPQGKITSLNALHMMWIWKNDAFPFTLAREGDLWKQQESLRLEFLVDAANDEPISNWVKEDKYIFVYGGDQDIEQTKKFINLAKNVGAAAKINLELLYVGKSCKKETVQTLTEAIKTENNLGNYLDDIPFFWTRLDSMLHSKIQLGAVDDVTDNVTQEIKKIISYDQNPGSWAVICKGSRVFRSVAGQTLSEVLGRYEEWKGMVAPDGGVEFHVALIERIEAGRPENMCFRFEFPKDDGKIPVAMKCPGCQKKMKDYVTFKCCHDDGVTVGDGAQTMTRASPIAI